MKKIKVCINAIVFWLNPQLGVIDCLKRKIKGLEDLNQTIRANRQSIQNENDKLWTRVKTCDSILEENKFLHQRLADHDAHWQAISDTLGGVSFAGVDLSVGDPLSNAGAVIQELRAQDNSCVSSHSGGVSSDRGTVTPRDLGPSLITETTKAAIKSAGTDKHTLRGGIIAEKRKGGNNGKLRHTGHLQAYQHG